MKKMTFRLFSSMLLFIFAIFLMPAKAMAADAVAPALANWQSVAASMNLPAMVRFLAALVVGAVLSPNLQAIIEHSFAALVDALPIWFLPFKGLMKSAIPTVISMIAAKVATALGVDPVQAYTAAVTMAGGAHLVNMSPNASDSTDK